MVKIALLIGVSEYEPGLNPLPASVRDMQAIAKVLQNPEMGDFAETDIQKLENPDPQKMQEAMETLFSDRLKDDLVVLYFSGHGIKDESGELHLATRLTCNNSQGRLTKLTTVPAREIHNIMSKSSYKCKRQVIILDCCFSGAFAQGLSAKGDGSVDIKTPVDIKTQLGGEGRVVLTSSNSTEYSFYKEGHNLSVYTSYLIEGIQTGAADSDNHGEISVGDLHEYAKKKVKQTAPAMQPEIYSFNEGFKIVLAKAPIGDPKLKYRKEVEKYAAIQGKISPIARNILDELRQKLELLAKETAAIETEVLRPHREYQQKLQKYEQVLVDAIERELTSSDYSSIVERTLKYFYFTRKRGVTKKEKGGNLNLRAKRERIHNELRSYQESLGLRDEDIAAIEERLMAREVQRKPINPSEAPPSVQPRDREKRASQPKSSSNQTMKTKIHNSKLKVLRRVIAVSLFLVGTFFALAALNELFESYGSNFFVFLILSITFILLGIIMWKL